MKWLQRKFASMLKRIYLLVKYPIIYEENSIFSIPLSDLVFDFNSEIIPGLKQWVKEQYDVELDQIIVCNFARVMCKDNPSVHNYQNETHLDIVHEHNNYIGILTIVYELKHE